MAKKHEFIEKIKNYHCPRYNELPPFALYTDQLKELLELYLSEFEMPGEEKFITPTMISNYVKQKIIPPPVKKKYDRDHIVYLIVVGIFKQRRNHKNATQILPCRYCLRLFLRRIRSNLESDFLHKRFFNATKIRRCYNSKRIGTFIASCFCK